jgi:hypothetical protein
MQDVAKGLYFELQSFDVCLFKPTGCAELHSCPDRFGLVCSLLGSKFEYVRMGAKVAYVLSEVQYNWLLGRLEGMMSDDE